VTKFTYNLTAQELLAVKNYPRLKF